MCPKTPLRDDDDLAREIGHAILWLARIGFRIFAALFAAGVIALAVGAALNIWHGPGGWFELVFSVGFVLVVLVCVVVFVGYHVEQFLARRRLR